MIGRLFSLFLFAAVGASLGWAWANHHPQQDISLVLVYAVLCGLGVWWILDAWRGTRVLLWLRKEDFSTLPSMLGYWGLWGQVVERIRRILRERDKALELSHQNLQNFFSAIQASPNGVVMLDDRGQIEWFNQTAATQLGFDAKRDLKQRVTNLLRDPAFVAYMQETEHEHDVIVEGRLHQPDRPVRIAIQRHEYGEGKQLLLTRDVTTLEQAEAMRRDFVANVSHEIRTPLTVLSGFVETLQTLKLIEPERQRYLNMMAVQTQRMQSLVADLLTLSKLEASPSPSFDVWLALGDWLSDVESEARGLSSQILNEGEAHYIRFVSNPSLRNAVILGDAKELQSALSNLVSNAVRYTPAGGRIEVDAQITVDGDLCLSVQDSGPGIAAEFIPRLTERFYRVDRSRSRETGGTGLGLAIVKHVMQRHGGELTIRSVVGQGSCFSLHVPATRWRQLV